jgi:uncharacterized protein
VFATAMAFLSAAVSAISAPGPSGPLAGTFIDAGRGSPVILIVPGSGPTDRDGNNPLGVTAAPYRLLAEDLAKQGVSTARIDKRGMFGSKGAVPDPNAVTINDYASDVRVWVAEIKKRSNAKCVWVLGHSEGGLIALAAMQQPENICGAILVAAPGRRMGTILRDQLNANPANVPILKDAMAAIDTLETGKTVDVTTMHPALQGLFAAQVQPFLIDMMGKDPVQLAAQVNRPMLIIGGERDTQVPATDARALADAQPKASLMVIPKMNHVLKDVVGDSPADNLKTYADPSLPVNRSLVDTIAGFVKG